MPFGQGFDEIYDLFLLETLNSAGFKVLRADDIGNSQNILKDILRGIASSNLIVADLTDSNPNVYYELGLAHALRKPVILFTQDISDIPFDLRSYRVIPYKTHFADITQARKQLTEIAVKFLKGEAEFGSPVSDFLPSDMQEPAPSSPRESPDEGEPGFLDHLVALEEGFDELTQILMSVGTQTEDLTETIGRFTQQIQSAAGHPGKTSARNARTLVVGLTQKLGEYAKLLSSDNDKYIESLSKTRSALETIVRGQDISTEDERTQLQSFLEQMNAVEVSTRNGLEATSNMTDTLRSLPSVERTFNSARNHTVGELQRLIQNVEQTLSMPNRTREIADAKLQAEHERQLQS
jgi:hypothetical protein